MGLSPDALLARLREVFGEAVLDTQQPCGEPSAIIQRDTALSVFRALRDQPEFAFDMLTDVTAADYLGKTPRFAVVYHLNSLSQHHRLRITVRVAEDDPWAHSLVDLWKSANWLERECWDMFGIRFVGHPDLRRILMYEEFVGHPLRKDYPKEKRQPLVRRDGSDV